MIFYLISAAILIIIAVCLLRTLRLKHTAAYGARLDLPDDERAEGYASVLSRMVRQETVSAAGEMPREKFYAFHHLLEEEFPNIYRVCEVHDFNGSLLFRWRGTGGHEPILLMSHMDVVAAGGSWQYPPFAGEIDGGVLWGRGTADTKASLFCLLRAAEELIAAGYEPECDVYLASSCTEEISGDGAPAIAAYLKENNIKLAMLVDEGGMIVREPIAGVKGIYAMVGVLEKGYGDVKFIAGGHGGHASAPVKNTPIPRLAKFIAYIDKHDPFKVKFNETVLEMFRRLTPNMSFGMRFVFANIWLFKPLLLKVFPAISAQGGAMLKTTIAFTTARGSEGLNVLPQEAYVTGNMRFIHHQGPDESIALISTIAARFGLETETLYRDYPCKIVDHTSDRFRLIEAACTEIYPGIGVTPYAMTGGTDAKFYNEVCDNCIRFAPLFITQEQMDSIHGLNESINVGSLPPAVDFYKYLIKNS